MTDALSTWLIGAGPMGQAYGHVLKALECPVTVVGRGEASAKAFEATVGLPVLTDGLDRFLKSSPAVGGVSAIVAVPVAELAPVTSALLRQGVRRILVEKPAAITPDDTAALAALARETGGEVAVAYNRRFLTSARIARRMIEEDGGVTGLRFEFAEFASRIAATGHPPEVKANWLYANSTHVIDLAFFLAGPPSTLSATVDGTLPWHSTAARFAGHGHTTKGALFSYIADWTSAPRWAVEVYTPKRAIFLQPLETVRTRPSDGFAETVVDVSDEHDKAFKPGLYRMTEAFLRGGDGAADLPDIAAHAALMQGPFRAICEGRPYTEA